MKNLKMFGLCFLSWFIYAYTFMMLYNWFIPTQFDVQKVNFVFSLGIILIFSFFSIKVKYEDKGKEIDLNEIFYLFKIKVGVCIILLVFGYIVNFFV